MYQKRWTNVDTWIVNHHGASSQRVHTQPTDLPGHENKPKTREA